MRKLKAKVMLHLYRKSMAFLINYGIELNKDSKLDYCQNKGRRKGESMGVYTNRMLSQASHYINNNFER